MILDIVSAKRALVPEGLYYEQAAAHTYLQLARIEFRYGREAEMEKYIEQALTENPKLRIPKDLLEM